MTCQYFPCDFSADDEYSPYCSECGRRDPMADLMMATMQRNADIADAMGESCRWFPRTVGWTVRDDGDYEFTDDNGTFFHVRVLPPLASNDVLRYGLYAKQAIGWDFVGMYRELPTVVTASWQYATAKRLHDMGIPPAPTDPPF